MAGSIYTLRISWVNQKWLKENPPKIGDLFPPPELGQYVGHYHNGYAGRTTIPVSNIGAATIYSSRQEATKDANKNNKWCGLYKIEVVEFVEKVVIK